MASTGILNIGRLGACRATADKTATGFSRFVDALRVQFQGGQGGDGCISMLHVFGNEFCGPDGGNGGCGGHVVLRADRKVKSFGHLSKTYRGLAGVRGMGKNLFGANGAHTFVEVPIGTIVTPVRPKELAEHEFDPEKSDIIAELDQHGSLFIAARGGAGGRGNATYLSNTNRHPRVAEAGAAGELNTYELRMKLYAHIGLIGLPNAGKSTLLKTLTRAHVRIGDYAFTTLHPQVGTIEYDDYTQIAISDLPGLIEDSHKNRGLGIKFLRHVQRCACLLYVIDLTNEPIQQLQTLWNELELYKRGLSSQAHMILANKIDHPEASANVTSFIDFVSKERPETKVLVTSSLRGDNLEDLRLDLRRMYDEYQTKFEDEPDAGLVW